jgi:hypothetical protein
MIIEVIQRPQLLAKVRSEIAPFIDLSSSKSTPVIDVEGLCERPLVQSIYAEVLRLHSGAIIAGVPRSDLTIEGWKFSRGEPILVPSLGAARNAQASNQGTPADSHPLDKFWPERFITDPHNSAHGHVSLQKQTPLTNDHSDQPKIQHELPQPALQLEGTEGHWLPDEGGLPGCPYSTFAKSTTIVIVAMFLTAIDIKVTPQNAPIQNDAKYFMLGIMPPDGSVSGRIRGRGYRACHHFHTFS